jgi:hypothetical protein
MYQVPPVGVFQPAGEEPWNMGNDFSLWRCIIRELAEEVRGNSENYDTHRRSWTAKLTPESSDDASAQPARACHRRTQQCPDTSSLSSMARTSAARLLPWDFPPPHKSTRSGQSMMYLPGVARAPFCSCWFTQIYTKRAKTWLQGLSTQEGQLDERVLSRCRHHAVPSFVDEPSTPSSTVPVNGHSAGSAPQVSARRANVPPSYSI